MAAVRLYHCMTASWLVAATQTIPYRRFTPDAHPAETLLIYPAWNRLEITLRF